MINNLRLDRLKLQIEQHGGQAQLAAELDVSPGYISQLMTKRRPFTEKTARKFEETLNLPRLWFDIDEDHKKIAEDSDAYTTTETVETVRTRTGKTALTIKIHTVPLLSKEQIIARDFKPGDKDHTQWINPITEVSPNAFAFTTDIFNTEMERYGYEDGTTIFIDPEKPLDNGKPVLITDTHGALIIRHIERIGNTTYLCSKSPLYSPIELNESIIIIGAIAGTVKTY